MVDGVGYHLLVTRNRRSGNDHRIAGNDLHFAVFTHGHTGQGGHRLALAACTDYNNLVIGIITDVVYVDQQPLRHFQVIQLQGNIDNIDHAAAHNRNLASELDSRIADLLDTVHIGRECGDNDTVSGVAEFVIKRFSHKLFALGITGTLRIRAVRHHQKNAAVTVFRETVQFHYLTVYRRLVNLKVAGVDNQAHRCMDRHANRVRDTVVDTHEFQFKNAGPHTVAGLYYV